MNSQEESQTPVLSREMMMKSEGLARALMTFILTQEDMEGAVGVSGLAAATGVLIGQMAGTPEELNTYLQLAKSQMIPNATINFVCKDGKVDPNTLDLSSRGHFTTGSWSELYPRSDSSQTN